MDEWDLEAIELEGPGFIDFADEQIGGFGFIAVRGPSIGAPLTTMVAAARTSPGRVTTTDMRPAVAGGRQSKTTGHLSATCSSTEAWTPDFAQNPCAESSVRPLALAAAKSQAVHCGDSTP